MSQTWSNLSNTASIISIADIAIGRGHGVISFLDNFKASEQTIQQLHAEIFPLRDVIKRLRDKLQSPSASKIPFQADIMLACNSSRNTLEELQTNLQSWVGADEKHTIGSSLNIAFRHDQIEATMAQLANWRGMIELAMTASILVQGERQAVETAHVTEQITKLLESVNKQKQAVEESSASALKDNLDDSNNLKIALEEQKASADALARLCDKVGDQAAAMPIEVNFGPVTLTERAVQYTGLVGTQSGSIRQNYQGISASGDTFGVHSVIGSDNALVRLAELHYQNLRRRDESQDEHRGTKGQQRDT